jgi:hypothetical protein
MRGFLVCGFDRAINSGRVSVAAGLTKNDKPSKLYSSTSMVDHEPTFTWWRMLEAGAHQEWWLDLQA